MFDYVSMSLETHIFFARIMKEHSLFLQAGFQMPAMAYQRRADWYRQSFERFLAVIVRVSNELLDETVLSSGEIVTEFTGLAEKQTRRLTGIPIDSSITEAEHRLKAGCSYGNKPELERRVRRLNREALRLTSGLIELKQDLLNEVNACQLYTANYPLLIEHIMREAKLYHETICELEERGALSVESRKRKEVFWNQIMMEHALFIRGLLDPTEEELIRTANGFAEDYKELLNQAREADRNTMDDLTRQTIAETIKYRDFKQAGTKGITECNISSLILPLLADHVLREANHYLRILTPEAKQDFCSN